MTSATPAELHNLESLATRCGVSPEQLLPELYQSLRRMAHQQLQGEREGHSLNTTALVHELYVRVVEREDLKFADRRAFFAYAARAMRHLLVDRARARLRIKRGGGAQAMDWNEVRDDAMFVHVDAALELDELMRQLAVEDPRSAEVLELHYFGGLTGEQIAEMLSLNRRTILRDLEFAKAFIKAQWQVR